MSGILSKCQKLKKKGLSFDEIKKEVLGQFPERERKIEQSIKVLKLHDAHNAEHRKKCLELVVHGPLSDEALDLKVGWFLHRNYRSPSTIKKYLPDVETDKIKMSIARVKKQNAKKSELIVRVGLKNRANERHNWQGAFVRYGVKSKSESWKNEKTILLSDITHVETGEIVADHIWLSGEGQLNKLILSFGDSVSFDASVEKYKKGYRGYDYQRRADNPPQVGYELVCISGIKKVGGQ